MNVCVAKHFAIAYAIFREKKKEREREELWKKLDQLAINRKKR